MSKRVGHSYSVSNIKISRYWLASPPVFLLFSFVCSFLFFVLATIINLEISMLLQSEEGQQIFFTIQGIEDAIKFVFPDLLFLSQLFPFLTCFVRRVF